MPIARPLIGDLVGSPGVNAKTDAFAAVGLLQSLLAKIDGQSPPPDWMYESQVTIGLAEESSQLIEQLLAQ
jgi:hypothetical protein